MLRAVDTVAGRPGAIVISYSELDTFKQCPHKHDLGYVQRWTQPKDERTAAGRGTMWHKILDSHYTALKHGGGKREVATAVAERVQDFRNVGKDPDVIDLLMWMYEGYLEKWGLDEEWEILKVEYKTIVPLKYRNGKLSRFDLKMVIDLVVRDRRTGKVWLIDHKSHAALPKERELELDDQFGLYTWGLRELGHKVFGAIYNTARTQRNKGDYPEVIREWEIKKANGQTKAARPVPQDLDARFDRYLMSRTPIEVENIAQDALATARSMYSRENRRERHTNNDTCKWKCDFTEACLLGRKTDDARELQFLKDTGFAQDFTRH
ncbi:exonuclease [Streptomyces phage Hiyaa]|uniref:Helicase n=1 Tax=Streptomyces phage Hiyaa TaxID=2499072 RepID=A0A3S9U8N3_9CAUD|nr:exonuclease [Streptomyces phage Hiyaa]AZS06681.1 helicase [Streptomyces phage Hiyaa]